MSEADEIPEAMEIPPGERLRQAREDLKLSQQEVAVRLHIGVVKIAALERGEIADLGAPVFVVGYLRAYARLLALPADELIAAFEGLAPSPAGTAFGGFESGRSANLSLTPSGRGAKPWQWGVLGLLFAAAFGVAAWFMLEGGPKPPVADNAAALPQDAPNATSGLDLPVPAPAQEAGMAQWEDMTGAEIAGPEGLAAAEAASDEPPTAPPVTMPSESADAVEDADTAMPAQEDEAGEGADTATDSAGNLPAAGEAALALYFQDDSWVEVRDARGERLVHRLQRAGEERTVYGLAPFEVVLGYVPGVRIEYNGEPVDLSLYQGRRLVRFQVGE